MQPSPTQEVLANDTQAAIRAGYSEKTAQEIASENLSKPMIEAYIRKRMTELEDLLEFNKSTIIQDLIDIKKKSSQAVPVMHTIVFVIEELPYAGSAHSR